ncbi:DUF1656 domain-containing protein [Alloalcanivorax profundimaris]|uniref:DUF1656 domain-containing protein n=1 Tax=Alloalcanivorax profundimaris TaxID=2735259 RepID=UPI001887DF14|nr:DUF1656 domain-containing protein [Alloalcanivorax profundimaris]MBF1800601.1 DUF1656 domain-containing protein [Alloalcanivorax profundimaris]MCQ6262262.1 DUF1656 domain-containing protein [Alcanivorax sp. MM125-6]
MLHEIDLGGVLLPPLMPVLLVALLLFWPLNRLISRYDGYRFAWHPALAGLCLYIMLCALSLALFLVV